MLQSMTGYGSSQEEIELCYISVEVKAINSKGLDISLRLPRNYFHEELKIRQLIGESITRGKLTVTIHVQHKSLTTSEIQLNSNLLLAVYHQAQILQAQMPQLAPMGWESLLSLPDVLVDSKSTVQETEWESVKRCLVLALQQLQKNRLEEGKSLHTDLTNQALIIEKLLTEIAPWEENRIVTIKNRILQNLKTLTSDISVSEEKFHQELFFYIEKLDIHEEKIRLATHLQYFINTLEEENSGRKLAFISQEMGREINTLGAKAYDLNIQKIVVEMKDALEKIKEQVNNVL